MCLPSVAETTALGAVYLTGLKVGYWKDQNEIKKLWLLAHTYQPKMDDHTRKQLINGWQTAVASTIKFKIDE